MRKRTVDHRGQLANAAMRLAYRRGFANSALADIAREAGIPLGNVYYYFKTKDEIGAAIAELRLARLKKLLHHLDRLADPRQRLCGFVHIKIENRAELARLGCPVGTLCSELHKRGGPVARKATDVFAFLLDWLQAQFETLGKGRESRSLALHLLSCTQGVSLLAHAFHDPRLIDLEAQRLKRWIHEL